MPIFLRDLHAVDREVGLEGFRQNQTIAGLGWPSEVVRQWLFEHGHHPAFLKDYGNVDLSRVYWRLEIVPVSELAQIQTGPSERGCLGEFAADHVHYLSKRPPDVRDAWEEAGTWVVPPILISGMLLDPPRACSSSR